MAIDATRYGVKEVDDGYLGCGVAVQQGVRSQGQFEAMVPRCNSRTPTTQQWPAIWAKQVAQSRPQIVLVLAGRWETQDAEVAAHWTSIEHPAYNSMVRSRLAQAVQVAGGTGAHVLLVTSPCFDGGVQPDGKPWPENNPDRVTIYNDDVRKVAAKHPGTVSVFDLDALVCPGGRFRTYANGVEIRDPDRIHFPGPGDPYNVYRFGNWIGPRLWPGVLRSQEP